jgi:hypothetical protein
VLQVLTLMQMNTRTGSKKVRCSHANDAKLLKFCQRTIDCGISVLNTKELLAFKTLCTAISSKQLVQCAMAWPRCCGENRAWLLSETFLALVQL